MLEWYHCTIYNASFCIILLIRTSFICFRSKKERNIIQGRQNSLRGRFSTEDTLFEEPFVPETAEMDAVLFVPYPAVTQGRVLDRTLTTWIPRPSFGKRAPWQ